MILFSLKDELHSKCECDHGYTGEMCEEVAAQWAEWGQWSPCEPICGVGRTHKRIRICIRANHSNCHGQTEQVSFIQS
ncbi:unnamed protein product [Protopolystoma xenopodis]|uniref:EGF-like domain-containing protein n=1 Tax=Protopolystoma xenopodis TaxID=117903 RepID=A0A3S5FH38_9PLAT|nr:unnamed protein product [Protopolystoma xenopodis]